MEIKPTIINPNQLEWETRDVYEDTPHGRVRWKTLLSGDRTPTAEITAGIVEIPPGEQLSLHQHAEAETYFIVSGQGFVLLDGERHRVQAGATVFIPGGIDHTIGGTGDELLVVYYSFPVDSFDQVKYEYK